MSFVNILSSGGITRDAINRASRTPKSLLGAPGAPPPSGGSWDYRWDWSNVLGESYIDASGSFTADAAGAIVPNSEGATLDHRFFTSPFNDGQILSITGKDFDHFYRAYFDQTFSDQQLTAKVTLPPAYQVEEIWFEWEVRWDSAIDVTDHKTWYIFTDTNTRWEIKFGAFTNRIQAKIDNGSTYNFGAVSALEGAGELDLNNSYPVSSPNTPLVWDDQWHTLRGHFRSGASGVYKLWIDGTLLVDGTPSTTAGDVFEEWESFGNAGPNTDFTMDVGDYYFWTSDPGW